MAATTKINRRIGSGLTYTDITAIRTATSLLPTPGEQPLILRTPHTPPLDLDALLTAEWRANEPW